MVRNLYKVRTNLGTFQTLAVDEENAKSRTILLIDGVTAVTGVTLVKVGK